MKKLFPILIISILFFAFAPEVKATSASLYLSPSAGDYTVGNTFSIEVKVNSGGVAINAADATLIFETNDLEVVKISKTDSVFSFWVEEPTYSNTVGTIDFAGGKPSPGYTGSVGTIVNITFKVKTAGMANITFAAGSILADDGRGTNILTHMGTGVYKLTAKDAESDDRFGVSVAISGNVAIVGAYGKGFSQLLEVVLLIIFTFVTAFVLTLLVT